MSECDSVIERGAPLLLLSLLLFIVVIYSNGKTTNDSNSNSIS